MNPPVHVFSLSLYSVNGGKRENPVEEVDMTYSLSLASYSLSHHFQFRKAEAIISSIFSLLVHKLNDCYTFYWYCHMIFQVIKLFFKKKLFSLFIQTFSCVVTFSQQRKWAIESSPHACMWGFWTPNSKLFLWLLGPFRWETNQEENIKA